MEKLTNETKSKIIENNNTISKLLERNEELFLNELSDFHRRACPIENEKRIEIPSGYVRKKEDFINLYDLKKITNNYQHQSNIAYLMQYADLTHYFFTRFFIFGQLEKVHYYYDIINLTAILEVILKELSQQYRDICKSCSQKVKMKCSKIISQKYQQDLKLLLEILNEFKIINLSQDELTELKNLIDLRNKIHLRLMSNTIYNNKQLSRNYFNNFMLSFKKLIKSINISNITCKNQ